jgi:hypothetical protein
MKIPFIILTKERPVQFREMIESIEKTTPPDTFDLIICDNASEQPEMKAYLETLKPKYKVLIHPQNLIFNGANAGLALIGNAPYFIFSDPDIILNPSIPPNWIDLFIKFFEKHNYPKVGCALDITRIPMQVPGAQVIYNIEKSYYQNEQHTDLFPDPFYSCVTDTTLCMYRRDTFSYWNPSQIPQFRPIPNNGTISTGPGSYNPKYKPMPARVAGRFTACHTGWEMSVRYQSDLSFYKKAIAEGKVSRLVASTLRTLRV